MSTDRRLALFAFAFFFVVLSPVIWFGAEAIAAGPGLYWEQSTDNGGTSVRRVRDTSAGVVCYVVREREVNFKYGDNVSVGISCLREKP